MRNLKLLIAFSSNMEEAAERIKQLCETQEVNLEVSYKVTKRGLLTDEKVQSSDCLLIQEYIDVTEPVDIEYLRNFDIINDLRIICVFEDKQRPDYASTLYANGFYDCIFEKDASFSNLVNLILRGRTKKEAQIYYGIKENSNLDVFSEYSNEISALIEFVKTHSGEKEVIREKFDEMTKDYSEAQIRFLVTELPAEVSEQLLHIPKFLIQHDELRNRIKGEADSKINRVKAAVKEKTIIKEKPIVSEVVKYIIPVTGAKNIGVCGLSEGAGSTFITMNLAAALADYMRVSVIEPPFYTPYIYDTLGIRGYLDEYDTTFYPFAHLIEEDKNLENNKEFKYNNVSWIVTDPDKKEISDWNYYKMLKLMYASKQSLLSVVDIGTYIEHESIKNVIEQFDMLLVVIDPFITQYMNNYNSLLYFKKLKEEGICVEFIVNKFNEGVDKKRMLDYLGIKPMEYVPFISPEYIYGAVYDCLIPYEKKEVQEVLRPAFDELIRKLVPEEIIRSVDGTSSKKKFSLFKRK